MATKRVQWSKILGAKGFKVHKDNKSWGFMLSVMAKPCTRQDVDDMVENLRAEGYDAHHYEDRKWPGPGPGAEIQVYNAEYAAAVAKLTENEIKMLKASA